MTVRKQSIANWIRQALTDEEKDGECSMISLVHMQGTKEFEIWTARLDNANKWDPDKLATKFASQAELFCEELPGTQRCCLLAFYGGDPEPKARKPFNISGVSEFDGLATEGPTGQGMVQQAMRHTEAVLQVCQKQSAVMFSQTQDMLRELATQNVGLMRQNREAHLMLLEIMRDQITNNHTGKLEEMRAQQMNEFKAQAMKLLPSLVNNLTGRTVFPEDTEDSALITAIAEKTEPEQLDRLLNSPDMPAHLRALLSSRVERILKQRSSAENPDARLANGADPELEVSGDADLTN